jgi:hypothetical protein
MRCDRRLSMHFDKSLSEDRLLAQYRLKFLTKRKTSFAELKIFGIM